MQGTLLVVWEKGYEERLAVVTDLLPDQAPAAWYQMRFWIEDEYQDHQRGGFHWEHTKMRDPGRAERLYLVMAVAMHLAILVGGQLEAQKAQQTKRNARPARRSARGRPARALTRRREREQSCLERGCQAISAATVRVEEIPEGSFVAEAWPRFQRPARDGAVSGWIKRRKRPVSRKSQAALRRQAQAERRAHTHEQAKQRQRRKADREAERHWKQQHREERQRWHAEVAQDRQRRLARSQARAARRAGTASAAFPSGSQKIIDPAGLGPLAQPP